MNRSSTMTSTDMTNGPAWRWELAERLVLSNTDPATVGDPFVAQAMEFYSLYEAREAACYRTAMDRAHAILQWEDDGDADVELCLLAGLTPAQTALARDGIDAEAVLLFSKVWFDVEGRFGSYPWLLRHVLNLEVCEDDLDRLGARWAAVSHPAMVALYNRTIYDGGRGHSLWHLRAECFRDVVQLAAMERSDRGMLQGQRLVVSRGLKHCTGLIPAESLSSWMQHLRAQTLATPTEFVQGDLPERLGNTEAAGKDDDVSDEFEKLAQSLCPDPCELGRYLGQVFAMRQAAMGPLPHIAGSHLPI